MQIYRTKENVYIRNEFSSHGTDFGHQHGIRFIVLGQQHGGRDIMLWTVEHFNLNYTKILVTFQVTLNLNF